MTAPLLEVQDLAIAFASEGGELRAVDGISFDVARGSSVALVGESGSGKTATALAIVRLLPEPAGRIVRGLVRFDERIVLAKGKDHALAKELDEKAMQRVRGGEIGFVFQEPMTALNPVYTIGKQVAETLVLHTKLSRRAIRNKAIEVLASVRFPEPARAFELYPHELSGGMRQRAVIATALAAAPKLLIADEPTTALDTTTQAEILQLLRARCAELQSSLLIVAHDLALVSEIADEIVVLYAGVVVEKGRARDVLGSPRHPYTALLLESVPPARAYRTRRAADKKLPSIGGAPPDLRDVQVGCRFAPRCPHVFDRCRVETPPLYETPQGTLARCFLEEAAPASGKRLALVSDRSSEPSL